MWSPERLLSPLVPQSQLRAGHGAKVSLGTGWQQGETQVCPKNHSPPVQPGKGSISLPAVRQDRGWLKPQPAMHFLGKGLFWQRGQAPDPGMIQSGAPALPILSRGRILVCCCHRLLVPGSAQNAQPFPSSPASSSLRDAPVVSTSMLTGIPLALPPLHFKYHIKRISPSHATALSQHSFAPNPSQPSTTN